MSFRSLASDAFALALLCLLLLVGQQVDAYAIRSPNHHAAAGGRERISINKGWRFSRWTSNPDGLIYDNRQDMSAAQVLKPWILPQANDFISDASKHHTRPAGNPGGNVSYVQSAFDDSKWEAVNLPHDWAIKGPFYTGNNPVVGGGMGRLPSQGIAWYRRKLTVAPEDAGKTIYLEIDGAQSYSMVWLNGNLVGGWPYGYASYRLDLTPYLKSGDNQLAIRLDNPNDSSRWYPGGGLYRNVWLTKVDPTHVGQWGSYVTTKNVSSTSAAVDLVVTVENTGNGTRQVEVATDLHLWDATTGQAGPKVAEFSRATVSVAKGQKQSVTKSATVNNPQLWGPPPTQKPNMYVAITRLSTGNTTVIDTFETHFGIRALTYSGDKGLLVNGEHIRVQGVDQHHDLGALGAAFNVRAAQRQLEVLRDVGVNAIRMSHNPPAPELLELTDRLGFVVMDEIFDCWERSKTPNDFHLIFPEWHEPDLRAFIRRDRNHPSVVAWSVGNEVGEQATGDAGAAIARELVGIAHSEEPTRPVTASMNQAKPNQSFPAAFDALSLNYQGEGIRDTPAYAGLSGTTTPPQYQPFHDKFPNKLLWSSETAAALSTRGTYLFPVTNYSSSPVKEGQGGNSTSQQVSAYELYSADFGASVDKVFAALDTHPFVAGEFVWSGFDYLGEPTPYYTARSSYFGIVDLAGFKKDRAYLYQSHWRPELKFAHILPHWNWPKRVGQVTPVHVFSSADEAELFVNGKSHGRLKKAANTYRFRWDSVTYQPGEVRVATYKNGQEWATATEKTTGAVSQLRLTADRNAIKADGLDLSYITLEVLDSNGDAVKQADNAITFSVEGPGEIAATDNGDPADLTAFPSKTRKAFSGLALAIVRAKEGASGSITVTATANGLKEAKITVEAH